MKIRPYIQIVRILPILLALVFVGCVNKTPKNKEILMVSIPPQKYMLEQIVGDKYDVKSMLSSGVNPETYDPSMSNMTAMENSKIYFRMDNIGFETAVLSKISENFPELEIVNSSAGIPLITGTHCGHHGHNEVDPHVWTSVKNAKIIARNMYETISEIDSVNRKYFQNRYNAFLSELEALDDSITSRLSSYKGESFLVWHPSLSYFAADYGLKQISIESEGKESSVKHYVEKLEEASNSSAKIFFYQKEYDSRQAQQIAEELGVTIVTVDLMGYDWKQEMIKIANALTTK